MGLVFATRRTWVETDYLDLILREDGYTPIGVISEVDVGDIVIYRSRSDRSVTHVGLVVHREPDVVRASFKFLVMSKWGQEGEYIHPIEEVPELLGEPVEFWTDRR